MEKWCFNPETLIDNEYKCRFGNSRHFHVLKQKYIDRFSFIICYFFERHCPINMVEETFLRHNDAAVQLRLYRQSRAAISFICQSFFPKFWLYIIAYTHKWQREQPFWHLVAGKHLLVDDGKKSIKILFFITIYVYWYMAAVYVTSPEPTKEDLPLQYPSFTYRFPTRGLSTLANILVDTWNTYWVKLTKNINMVALSRNYNSTAHRWSDRKSCFKTKFVIGSLSKFSTLCNNVNSALCREN